MAKPVPTGPRTTSGDVRARNLPHYDQQPTKPSSVASLVLRFCSACKRMRTKAGSRAGDAKFVCAECLGEDVD